MAEPLMGSRGSAFMLQAKPGCYIRLGSAQEAGPARTPSYDDRRQLQAKLVEIALPRGASRQTDRVMPPSTRMFWPVM